MDAPPPEGEGSDTLAFRPTPWLVNVAHLSQGEYSSTAISRGWLDGEEKRCKLCSQCSAVHGHCLILVPWHVPLDSATFFAFRDDPGPEGQQRSAV